MGGFLYHDKTCQSFSSESIQYSLQAIKNKKLADGRCMSIKEVIDRDGFTLYLFGKIGLNTENIDHYPNGDFVLYTGTLIYKSQTGLKALQNLYSDFDDSSFQFNDFQGHCCVFIYKQGKLNIWNDYFGIYHVFTDKNKGVISSSFLSVVRLSKSKNIDHQAMYEYVNEGASYGDDTFIEEVKLLDAFYIHELISDSSTRKKYTYKEADNKGFDDLVEQSADSLTSYFKVLKNCFDHRVCSALSGGYDSRLILALLSKVDINPYLYVYGNKSSPDVRIAEFIAAKENLKLNTDNRVMEKLSVDEFYQLTKDEYFFCDGHGPNGVLSNGSEFVARSVRSNVASLQLNGGGGEIFRNFWKLPDREIAIETFLAGRFDRYPESVFKSNFRTQKYLLNLANKVQLMMNMSNAKMTRKDIEKLYVYMRIKYWMGYNTTIQNSRSFALIPLTEPKFAFPSFDIPFKYKGRVFLKRQ